MFCWPPSRRCLANARSARPRAGSEIGTRGIKTALHRNQQPNNRRKSNCRKHQRGTCESNGKRCYQSNGQYSVTALTDTTGTISERYAYTAYGELTVFDGGGTVLGGSAYGNRYTYTGREWDGELGLFHYRARMYSPESGRFVSRDPIGYVAGDSLYRGYFVPDSTDPTGLLDSLSRVFLHCSKTQDPPKCIKDLTSGYKDPADVQRIANYIANITKPKPQTPVAQPLPRIEIGINLAICGKVVQGIYDVLNPFGPKPDILKPRNDDDDDCVDQWESDQSWCSSKYGDDPDNLRACLEWARWQYLACVEKKPREPFVKPYPSE